MSNKISFDDEDLDNNKGLDGDHLNNTQKSGSAAKENLLKSHVKIENNFTESQRKQHVNNYLNKKIDYEINGE